MTTSTPWSTTTGGPATVEELARSLRLDVGDLADQVGADKLELIQWVRADIAFARLIDSKVTK